MTTGDDAALLAASRIVGAMAASQPGDAPDASLRRFLEAAARALAADVAIALRPVDDVTARVVAAFPSGAMPDDVVSPALLFDTLETGDLHMADGPREPPALRGALAVVPCARSTGLHAVALFARNGGPAFDGDDRARALLQALPPLLALAMQSTLAALAAQETQRSFDVLVHTIPDALVFLGDGGVDAWVNDAAGALLGIAAGSVEPYAIAAAMADLRGRADNHDEIVRRAADLFAHVDATIRDWRWIFSTPKELVLNASSVPAKLGSGRGRLWTFADVTAQHRGEQALAQKNAALEIARRDADQANAAKTQFLATMSHEIRTPMNGVIGMTRLLMETPLDSTQRRLVEVVRSSGDALLVIIDDILDFSKIEAGLFELERRPFDLLACLRESVELLVPKATEKTITLALELDPAVPNYIQGDTHRLRQVLVNLIGNAVKFTLEGGVKVVASMSSALNGAPTLELSVIDTGIGIPQDRLDKLFRSFSQVDSSTSRMFGGTGLGLAISRRLVTFMGGRIEVESTANVGSTFRILIAIETAAAAAPRTPIDDSLDATMATRIPLQILIAEDNLTNQKVLAMVLTKLGYKAIVARNGYEALEASRAYKFDVIFMDIQMPHMDGLEATRRIRAGEAVARETAPPDAQPRPACIVAMTASVMEGDRDACFAAGMDDYASKPLRVAEVKASLRRAGLKAGRTSQPLSIPPATSKAR